MWKPTNTPTPSPTPSPEPQRSFTPPAEPVIPPRPSTSSLSTQEQATLGKSLVIKGEVTGSESLYIDGRVEGSINLPGNRVTVDAMAWSRPTFPRVKSWCWARSAAI